MKAKIKKLTSRSNGWGNTRRKETLRQYITGWVQYFKLADMNNLLLRLDQWYRRRLRMVIWKQWKRIKTKFSNLIKLGVKKSKAWDWGLIPERVTGVLLAAIFYPQSSPTTS